MSGRFPNIRYEDSYDSFKYDDVLKTEVLDYMKIRGSSGIINQNIADIVIDGGLLSKQGIMVGQAKVGGQVVDAKTTYSTEYSGTLSFNKKNNELVIIKKDGIAFDMLDANVNFYFANVEKTLTAGSAIVDTSFETDTLLANTGNINGDLQIKTITMNQFSVDINGNVISNYINNSNGGIVNTGPILGATDIKASGHLVMGGNMLANGDLLVEGNFRVNGNTTIINTENKVTKDHLVLMNYGNSTELTTNSGIIIANVENPPYNNLFFGTDKDGVFTSFLTDSLANSPDVNFGSSTTARFGNIILTETSSANAINTEGDIHVGDIFGSNIDGSGDLTMNTITMTGFSVDTSGNIVTTSIDNSNGGIINVGDLIGVNDFSLSGNLITQGIDNNNTFINNAGIISNVTHVEGNVNIKGGALSYPVTSQYYPVQTDFSFYFDSTASPNNTIQTDFQVTSDQNGLFLNNLRSISIRELDSFYLPNGNNWNIYYSIQIGGPSIVSSRKEVNFRGRIFSTEWVRDNIDFQYSDINGDFQSMGEWRNEIDQLQFKKNDLLNNQKTQWAATYYFIGGAGSVDIRQYRLNEGLCRVLYRNDGTYWMIYFKDGQDGSNTGFMFDPTTGWIPPRAPSQTNTHITNPWENNPNGTSSTYNTLYKVLPISLSSVPEYQFYTDTDVKDPNIGYSFTYPEINEGSYTSKLYWTRGYYLDETDGAFTQISNPEPNGIPIGTYGVYNYSLATGYSNVITGKNLNWMSYTRMGNVPSTDGLPVAPPNTSALNGIYPFVYVKPQPEFKMATDLNVRLNYIISPKIKICAKDASSKTNIYNNTYGLVNNNIISSIPNYIRLFRRISILAGEGLPITINTQNDYLLNSRPSYAYDVDLGIGLELISDYNSNIILKINEFDDYATDPVTGTQIGLNASNNVYVKEYETINVSNNLWNTNMMFRSTNLFPSPQGKLVTPQLYINSSTDPVGTKGEIVLDQFRKLCFWDGSEWQKVTSSTWT